MKISMKSVASVVILPIVHGVVVLTERHSIPINDRLLSYRDLEFIGDTLDFGDALASTAGNNDELATEAISRTNSATYAPNYVTDVGGDMQDSTTPEIFPLVLGTLLIVAVVFFTTFALWTVFKQWREDRDGGQATKSNVTTREQSMKDSDRNSWVLGRIPTPSLCMAEEGNGQFETGEDHFDGEEGAILSWKNLSCTYPVRKSRCADVTTLEEVTGHIEYNELVAIMGPSGGGKTTMVDIMSGRKSLGKVGGEMSVLGESMASDSSDCRKVLRDVVAYVPQDVQFFPNQTPEEAVAFAANLKLGKDERGCDVRKRRIAQILDLVGISDKARKRAIGGTLAGGLVIRGLSGGEHKRLALACAVAMKPSLLFLDEITSGLDSENAVIVIDLIKKLCVNMNAAAVVVIHQPSYEVFSYFDRLILLAKGKCLYADKLANIPSFYEEIGRDLPEKYFIPSDILKAASTWDENTYTLGKKSNDLVETCGSRLLQDIKRRKKPTSIWQIKIVILRQMTNHYLRNLTNLLARVLTYALVSLLFGCVFWEIGEIEDGQSSLSLGQAQATFGAGIFLIQGLYLIPFCQVSTFFFDKNLFASESSIGLYPAWVYSLSQVVLELWVMVLCALTETAIAVPMTSLWNPSYSRWHSFVTMFTVFCVSGVAGNSVAMLISIVMFSQDLAFLVGSGFITICLALSGGFVPFPFIGDWIKWLQWISPIKYSFQAYTWSLLSNTSAEGLLKLQELDTPTGVSSNIGVLIGVFILCTVCSVFALSRKREVR